jgi:hypothetical protein
MDAVGWQRPARGFRPDAGADVRQSLAVVGKHRHAADIGFDRHLFEQGLQHPDIARGDAVFGRRRQLAGNRRGARTQRLVEVVDFSGDELEQQQDADDGHRHQGQADDASAYPQ